MRCLFFLACLWICQNAAIAQNIRVVDERGATVDRFEAMYSTAHDGWGPWEKGVDGRWQFPPSVGHVRRADVVDVIVRADGYATTIVRLDREAIDALGKQERTIVLTQGNTVDLQLNLPKGVSMPEGLGPEVYPTDYAERARMMWQPDNRRESTTNVNYLNVQPRGDGHFSFQLAETSPPFYVAIYRDGWLRFFERGPFTAADLQKGALPIDVPRPASVEVRFDDGGAEAASLPFDKTFCEVRWPNPAMANSFYAANRSGESFQKRMYRLTDLAPGAYTVVTTTQPRKAAANADPRRPDPGRFYAQTEVVTAAGETARDIIRYVPFDADAWRGSGRARISLLAASGEPAAGKAAKIGWFDGHYGSLDVFNGPVPANGVVELTGVSTAVATEAPFGPFSVSIEEESLGFFRIEANDKVQDFEFRIAPKTGDVAPDFPLVNIQSGESLRLADFHGKIVLVEFWATWCGPCQPALAELCDKAATNKDKWQDSVVIVPVSTDKKLDRVARHLASRGWDAIPQFWAARNAEQYFSPAESAYGVFGIPQAVLIDREGRIAWRGHPTAVGDGIELVDRIEALRSP